MIFNLGPIVEADAGQGGDMKPTKLDLDVEIIKTICRDRTVRKVATDIDGHIRDTREYQKMLMAEVVRLRNLDRSKGGWK